MTLCLHRQTGGSSCQVAPVAQVPAEPQTTGVPVPAWMRIEHLKLLFHKSKSWMNPQQCYPWAIQPLQPDFPLCWHTWVKSAARSKRVRNSFWELLCAGGSPTAELPPGSSSTGTAVACSSSQKKEPCPKPSFLLRNSFFKAVLAPVFHSCQFYVRSRSTSVFSLLQATFQVFVKSSWRFTNSLSGFGLAGCKGFVKHIGSYSSPGAAEILEVKRGHQEHLYVS